MSLRRYPIIQKGRGLGNLFGSIFRSVLPVLKSVFKSPITKNILTGAKDLGISTATNLVADVVSGKNFGESVKENVAVARDEIADSIRSSRRNSNPDHRKVVKKNAAKRKSKKTTTYSINKRLKRKRDIFDYDDANE